MTKRPSSFSVLGKLARPLLHSKLRNTARQSTLTSNGRQIDKFWPSQTYIWTSRPERWLSSTRSSRCRAYFQACADRSTCGGARASHRTVPVAGIRVKRASAQSAESLAGRVRYIEMPPLLPEEVGNDRLNDLWLRGGFPDSFQAADDRASLTWREDFCAPTLSGTSRSWPAIPATTLRRFWTMLAHAQGGLAERRRFGRGVGVSGQTIGRYLDLLGRSDAGAAADALACQCRQTPGQITQDLCPRPAWCMRCLASVRWKACWVIRWLAAAGRGFA